MALCSSKSRVTEQISATQADPLGEPVRLCMRLNVVKLRVGVVAAAAVLGACTASDSADDPESVHTPEMMAAALVELITEDHTFGEGPPPFTEYLIQDRIDPSAGEPAASTERPSRELTEAERGAIEEAVAEYGAVRWIEDPDEWRTSELTPTVEGGVILGVGEPTVQDDTGLVPVSLWCGGTCGTWFTYRLDLRDGSWVVTGIEGSIAVS